MSSSKVTTNHDEIRRWVEERGGHPACVKQTGRAAGDVGVLRIDFPGFSGEGSLESLEWDRWFKAFDANGLAFLYQDELGSGEKSRFNKLVSRDAGSRQRGKES